jgi:hypothetical protein
MLLKFIHVYFKIKDSIKSADKHCWAFSHQKVQLNGRNDAAAK